MTACQIYHWPPLRFWLKVSQMKNLKNQLEVAVLLGIMKIAKATLVRTHMLQVLVPNSVTSKKWGYLYADFV